MIGLALIDSRSILIKYYISAIFRAVYIFCYLCGMAIEILNELIALRNIDL